MLKYLKTAAAALSIVLLSGCTFGTSIDTLMAPPKLSLEQEQMQCPYGRGRQFDKPEIPEIGKISFRIYSGGY